MTVSVIIPTYQRRELVRRAVDSVLAQSYRDFELIVIDDGSSDGTSESLEPLGDAIRYRWQPNRGVAAARNAGLELARGSIVAFLDSDNRWLPYHLAVVTEVLERYPEAVLASTCPGYRIEGRGRSANAELVDCRHHLWTMSPAGFISCVAVRREALRRTGGFDERMGAREDTDLWTRLALLGPFSVVRHRTIVRQATDGSLRESARRSGGYLTAAELNAENLAGAAERMPEPERHQLSTQARGLAHFAQAMRALDRGDRAAVRRELEPACRLLPLSALPDRIDSRVRRQLTRSHVPAERLRAQATLAELWPDQRADTARFMRALAITSALRLGRLRQAAELLAGWPRGGSFRFAWRVAPVLREVGRRSLDNRRTRGSGAVAPHPRAPGLSAGEDGRRRSWPGAGEHARRPAQRGAD